MKESLILFGLTEAEADQFKLFIEKLNIPKTQIDAVYHELDQGIPFEGGVSPGEAIILLYIASKENN